MMTTPQQVFLASLLCGLLLVGAEIFVPGGILGFFGAVALVVACAAGFSAFPGYGPLVASGVVGLAGLAIFGWIRFFPKSPLGRRMTVAKDLSQAHGTEDGLDDLIGRQGVAASDLRPAGFATIDGRRVDVVTEGGMLSRGDAVRVTAVEGNRVVVRLIEAELKT